jgi:hypothetical protein
MGTTLGGATFVYNGIKLDYCFLQTIECLIDLCDQVVIVAGGTDGTIDAIMNRFMNTPGSERVRLVSINEQQWQEQKGREKLSFFMNMALAQLTTDWIIAVQADEVIFDRSFKRIRRAIDNDRARSYVMTRYNAWRDPLSHLTVEQSRKPCSTEVIRLARRGYQCYGDGEHLAVDAVVALDGHPDSIEMYHAGYIRDNVKHVHKAYTMLVEIFGMEWDKRIGEKFDYRNFPFTGKDISPIPLPLPSYLIGWLQERFPDIKLVSD